MVDASQFPVLADADFCCMHWINDTTAVAKWQCGSDPGLLLCSQSLKGSIQVKVQLPFVNFPGYMKTIHLVVDDEQSQVLAICDLSCMWVPDLWYAPKSTVGLYTYSEQKDGAICPCCGPKPPDHELPAGWAAQT